MSLDTTPQLFTHFSRLPLEIRIMIWLLNLPTSRNVRVHYNISTGLFHSTARPLINLHVCRESRLEARHWRPQFRTQGHPAQICANFDIDHLHLDWDPIRLKAIPADALLNIRWLEIGGMDLQSMPTDRLLAQLLSFGNLEHLTIVSPPPETICAQYHSTDALARRLRDGKEEMPARVRAEIKGHEQRRLMAFTQHTSLAQAMWALKDVSKQWKFPRLWLVIMNECGERVGPYFWKRASHRVSNARLEFLGMYDKVPKRPSLRWTERVHEF